MLTRKRIFIGSFLLVSLVLISLYFSERKKVSFYFKSNYLEKNKADCGVVLTGGPGRIREGIDLLADKFIKKLVISGVNPSSNFKQIFPLWVYYPEVQEADVILEKRSETTFGNAIQSLPLVEVLKCQDVLLVTSQLHSYRAYRTFRKIFPKNIEIKISPSEVSPESLTFFDMFQEVLKSLFYSLWVY
ncbi:MAG: YdcF family protein [Bdellovibrionaceae bacterium]|nr:YdcF family protein [Pseudobdellovibrionaceae bacterium]